MIFNTKAWHSRGQRFDLTYLRKMRQFYLEPVLFLLDDIVKYATEPVK